MKISRIVGLRPTAFLLAVLIGAVPGAMSARTVVSGGASVHETSSFWNVVQQYARPARFLPPQNQ